MGRPTMKNAEICDSCGAQITSEKYEETRYLEDGTVEREVYCSYECELESHQLSVEAAAEELGKREINEIHRQVCPACRRRFLKRI